jgi:undecaprenyl-diphosphatase
MSQIVKAAVLGIVEGLTEFLPISSTGHLILINEWINFTGDFARMFDIIIQLGAILAVIVYFRKKLFPFGWNKTFTEKVETWAIWKKVFIALIPALLAGALLGDFIEKTLFNPVTVAFALLIGGVFLIIVERRKMPGKCDSFSKLSYQTALLIGLFQCLALIPGTSRSAVTIIGAMFLGTTRLMAAEFSFFLAIPTLVAASAYAIIKTNVTITAIELQSLFTGFGVSFAIAWLVIAGFMKFISHKDFKAFGYYRIILGTFILIYWSVCR